jgi:hypothetical protein
VLLAAGEAVGVALRAELARTRLVQMTREQLAEMLGEMLG